MPFRIWIVALLYPLHRTDKAIRERRNLRLLFGLGGAMAFVSVVCLDALSILISLFTLLGCGGLAEDAYRRGIYAELDEEEVG